MNLKQKVTAVIPQLEPHWKDVSGFFKTRTIPQKTTLLEDGDISKYIYMVSKGCLRLFVIKDDGKEVTVQFFFENQMVASMGSAFTGKPGRMYLESIEESEVIMIRLQDFRELFVKFDELKHLLIQFLQKRLLYYADLYTSFILNTPAERYIKLVEDNPGITERVPHYYIATYLGITPVSLSRIRSRLAKKNQH